MTDHNRSLRVAIYTGNYNTRDGVGRVVRQKVDALRAAPDGGWQVTVFCQESNIDDPDVRVRGGLSQVVNDPAFREADIHVFHGGWTYWLLEALLFVPPTAKAMVHYEGLTPPEFLNDPAGYLATWKHRLVFHKADIVLASSPYNAREMAEFGIAPGRLGGVLTLATTLMPRTPPAKAAGGPVNLLQVGRLVPNKGTPDLIAALAMLHPALRGRLHLKIVGSREAADRDYLAAIDAAIAEHRLGDTIEFTGMVEDDRLSKLYAEADALLQPSYHEGFGLPVPEAYAHGCHVIAYDNSNLPDVAGGLGRIVPTGDIAALSAAIAEFVEALDSQGRADGSAAIQTDSGPKSWRQLQEDVRAYAERYSSAAFGPAFRGALENLLRAPPSTVSRLNPAQFFEDRRSFTIRQADLTIKDVYDKPELAVRQNRSIEYRRERHGGVSETLLFYGPYSDLPAGRWQVQVDADLEGECLLRLTRNCGTFVHEERLSPGLPAFEFEAREDLVQFETTLFLLPETRAISLRGIQLKRVD
ncbi:MAG TPA: glycosyltransferase family 4 protein [Alphaproteobacteria bacterium]|jgi:glycosyltransferase involved in cell wall biosynthesis|nr:glycosyltransferase family 4 protein [Alphaproteobacteria bacterium]